MKKVLNLQSSIFSEGGQSYQLSNLFLETLRKENPEVQITTRDLAKNPVPHLDGERLTAHFTPEDDRTKSQKDIANFSNGLIAELEDHDTLVIGLPMYNFGIPSTLKSWIDHIAQAGRTFKYTDEGPVGLLEGKKAYVLMARGGLYKGTDADTQTGYIKNILAFIGITDVEIVFAEGLNMGDESKKASLDTARDEVITLVQGIKKAA